MLSHNDQLGQSEIVLNQIRLKVIDYAEVSWDAKILRSYVRAVRTERHSFVVGCDKIKEGSVESGCNLTLASKRV